VKVREKSLPAWRPIPGVSNTPWVTCGLQEHLCSPVSKQDVWLAKFLTSRHMRTRRVIFYVSNTLLKVLIRSQDLVLR